MLLTTTLRALRPIALLMVLCLAVSVQAQTTPPAWAAAYATAPGAVSATGTVDDAGNVYEAGQFTNSITVGGTTLTSQGSVDIYLAKFTPAGNLAWLRQLGSTDNEVVGSIATDAAGAVYVTGNFRAPMALGNNVNLTYTGNNSLLFVACYSAQGTPQWAQQSSLAAATPFGIGADSRGNVYLAGRPSTTGIFTFGTVSLTLSYSATFIARLSAVSGAVQAMQVAYEHPTTGSSFPKLWVAPSGETYLAIYFTQSISFSPTNSLTSVGGSTDAALAKYDAQGALAWVQQLSGPGDNNAQEVRADAAGNVYLVGSFSQNMRIGAVTLSSQGNVDGYLAKFTPQGTLQWARSGGGSNTDYFRGLAVDAAGNPYAIGGFTGTAYYGSVTLTNGGFYNDLVLVAYTAQGTLRWVQQARGTGNNVGRYIGFNATGDVLVGGMFSNTCSFGLLSLTATNPGDPFWARLNVGPLATRPVRAAALAFHPNPATTLVQLPTLPAYTRVQFVDALGRVARETSVSTTATVSVLGLAPGLYTLRATDTQGRTYANRLAVE